MPPKKKKKIGKDKVPDLPPPKIVKEKGPNLALLLPPIVDETTLELLKNGKRIHVQHPCNRTIMVVYILPQQSVACANCGLLATNFESFERHQCTPPPTNSIKKYVPQDTLKKVQVTDPPHVFIHRWGESCLVHDKRYNYACICGAVFGGESKLRNLQRHFDHNPCYLLESLFPPTGTIVTTQDVTPAFNTGQINVFNVEKKDVRSSSVLGFAFPLNEEKIHLVSNCRHIQIVLARNFSKIQDIVSAGHDTTTNGCQTIEEFGAVSIQSDRLEICVRREKRSNGRGTGCWNFICTQFGIKQLIMEHIIDAALQMAKRKAKGKFKYDTISIIVTNSPNAQHPHIDIGDPLVQHGMMLSDGDTSTIAYKVTDSPPVKNKEHIVQLFQNLSGFSEVFSEVNTDYPSKAFLQEIDHMLTVYSSFREKFIEEGWCRLFQVCIPGHFETHSLTNAAAGTLTTIKGGVVHKGSGAAKDGGVRSVLFFTGSPAKSSKSYNSDVQHTAITVFVQCCQRIKLIPGEKAILAQMIETLLILLNQCHVSYRQSVPSHFRNDGNYIRMHQLLTELCRRKQHTYSQQYIEKITEKYLKLGHLFPGDELI